MTGNGRSLTLLWNDSSGWDEKEKVRQSIESTLTADGESLQVERVHHGGNLREISKSIVSSGTDVLIAAGGDGTINAAASALVHQQAALGVIPAGTLNHFARDLHIPLDPEEAARVLLTSGTLEVDAGEVNGRIFINNSVLGLFPNYRSTREAWERRGFGRSSIGRLIAMAAGMLRVFWRLPHLSVEIEVGSQARRLQTPFVLIGNNEHRMQGLAPGERSSLSEGSLWVYVMRRCTRWGLLRMLAGLVLGRTPRHSVFEVFRASRLRINSKPRRIGVGVDGEMVRMVAPLEYRCLPKALRVITPLAGSSKRILAD
ncbi:MAG: sphingosine kinase [Bryobacterales bacterium]|jgi:diacylglycerol kinase family enzyme|nr:sphingosine kinase [Bryobacterales bacterium]